VAREDELAELLLRAASSLEEAVKAKVEGDIKTLSERIWEVGADLEYVTFIMGLSREGSDDFWKEGLKTSRAVDVDEELSTVQRLLKEASSAIDTDLEEAYRKAWYARGHILRVQRELEKTTTRQSRRQP